MLIELTLISTGKFDQKFFRKKEDFEDFIIKLNRESVKSSWWLLYYDSDDYMKNEKEKIVTNDLLEILKLWKEKKITATYAPTNSWLLTLIQCESREEIKIQLED